MDLYILYLDQHWDLYKYSPTFAAFMGAFWYLPDWLGLTVWNFLNVFVLAFAIYELPISSQKRLGFIALFALLETIVATQNDQSNALMTGLMILGLGLLDKNKIWAATLCLMLTVFIKIFGIVAFCMLLFYPKLIKKAVLSSAVWLIVLAVFPLLFVDWNQLVFLYKSWLHLLANDHSTSIGLSVAGWLHSWFGFTPKDIYVLIFGVIVFFVGYSSLLKNRTTENKLLTLGSVLIWVVIFNHKAESPTFVIAMCGAAIWLASKPKITKWDIGLMVFCFVFTSLSTTDLVPRDIRKSVVDAYVLKAFPLIVIWAKLIYDQLTLPKMSVIK